MVSEIRRGPLCISICLCDTGNVIHIVSFMVLLSLPLLASFGPLLSSIHSSLTVALLSSKCLNKLIIFIPSGTHLFPFCPRGRSKLDGTPSNELILLHLFHGGQHGSRLFGVERQSCRSTHHGNSHSNDPSSWSVFLWRR